MGDQTDRRLESCLRMTEALLDAMEAAVRGADPGDVWRFSSYKQFMRKADELVEMAEAIEHIEAPVDRYNLEAVPGSTSTIAMVQQELFDSVRANLSILRAYLQNRVHPKAERISEIADFLEVSLRRAVLQKPEREKQVQDVVEQLLIGRGLEKGLHYDRETGRVKVSAKEVIPDFVLLQLATAIEVKLVKESSAWGGQSTRSMRTSRRIDASTTSSSSLFTTSAGQSETVQSSGGTLRTPTACVYSSSNTEPATAQPRCAVKAEQGRDLWRVIPPRAERPPTGSSSVS